MNEKTLHIKNMVCRRCVMAVEDICRDLNLHDAKVSLGCINFSSIPDSDILNKLSHRLRAVGFEPLQSHEHILLEKIKAALRYYARQNSDINRLKISAYIENAVKHDFRYVSRVFSSLENRTIQSYLMAQRIEYVKELLFDQELSLGEIADKVGFSSVAHLSRSFKKSQGVTISEFRGSGGRISIDEI